jgi:outer membrane protein assembly factor BamA
VGTRDYYRLEIKSSWFFRGFAANHVLELSAKAGVTQALSGGDVPFYDREYLGGQDSLRGYNYHAVGPRQVTQDGTTYEPIGGDSYWFGSAEYTIPIISRLSFALFYDIGNVSVSPWSNSGTVVQGRLFDTQPFISQFQRQFNFGSTTTYSDDFGFGLRLSIPTLGPLRLDYGIPIHHDPFNSGGKFQFGAGFSRPL